MDEYKWRGQIPAFGNWEYANELPITQYFESARQAGLLRFSNSSGEGDLYVPTDHLHSFDFNKPLPRKASSLSLSLYPFSIMTRVKERKYGHAKEQRRQGSKVCDEKAPPRKQAYIHNQKDQADAVSLPHHPAVAVVRPPPPPPKPKPVDEDLYKIPPELLYSSKRESTSGKPIC
ncbi:hypothetical protein RJ641_020407 [Dillenia turbinata]|uniref:Uncharacterized protein n=1 Tax=Dillenia turbinata TaxID=194707 RepID=A0AAN8UGR2_9MAGN